MSFDAENMDKAGANYLPLISIITVVLNGAKTIEQTILSVIEQPYPNKEYIIIDGGSTDGTIDIIKKYRDKIQTWISESDNGIYDAMNKGISLAKGDLVGIINADDWYGNNILSEIADCYRQFGNNTVIHGLLRNIKQGAFYSIKGNSIHTLKYDMIQHPTCFVPKALYDKYGSYDIKYKYSADYDFVLRLVNQGVKFEFIEKVIANFRIGGVSSEEKTQSEKYQILKNHKVISSKEAFLRIAGLKMAQLAKKVIGSH